MDTNSLDDTFMELSESKDNITKNRDWLKVFRSFFEFMICLSVLTIGILGILLVFPPEGVNAKLTKIFLLEFCGFLPYTGIFAFVLSCLKFKKKENGNLVLWVLIYSASIWMLTNLAAIYWTSVAW